MIAEQPHLMAHERNAVDRQFRKRWVTLLSVDDAIAAVSETLDELNLSDSTYFFVTSDQCVNLRRACLLEMPSAVIVYTIN